MNENLPLYQRIKSQLRMQIGELPSDARIPSENELVKTYSVSRGTAKQAITELVYEGFLYRVRGKGTFVSPPKINRRFNHLQSFTGDVLLHGKTPSNRILFLAKVAAPPQIADKLNISMEAPVLRFKRIVLVNEDPLALVCSYLRCDYFPDLQLDEVKNSLYAALMDHYGIAPRKALDTYSVLLASPKTANYLQISENSPLIYSERIAFLTDAIPVEYVESFIRSDKYQLTVFAGQDNDGNQITQILPKLNDV